jgi:hypothetical protein
MLSIELGGMEKPEPETAGLFLWFNHSLKLGALEWVLH